MDIPGEVFVSLSVSAPC